LRKSSELKAIPFMSLDLTPGRGNLLGEFYWELISPWLGGSSMRNTGVSPREGRESFLSQILQTQVPLKYYLSQKACLGILRRANERGKTLPPRLEQALRIQAGLEGVATSAIPAGKSYHINQRNEGIDLGGISGALMATPNIQMQTFVPQSVMGKAMAFAANQRDEVRNLHDVAGALGAQPGMKQQTFLLEDSVPNLKAVRNEINTNSSVLCLNDQGGSVMGLTENMTGTLRAQEHGHQPLIFENHGKDCRYKGPLSVVPTMSAAYGTGGNNTPFIAEPVICITGNAIDRQPQNGGNGIGVQEDISYTLTATDHHAVCSKSHLIRRLTPTECERLQGFPDGWTDIPGASDSARYKALGNSVAIPCVEYLLHGIALTLQASDCDEFRVYSKQNAAANAKEL
jgi:hypothetical protein